MSSDVIEMQGVYKCVDRMYMDYLIYNCESGTKAELIKNLENTCIERGLTSKASHQMQRAFITDLLEYFRVKVVNFGKCDDFSDWTKKINKLWKITEFISTGDNSAPDKTAIAKITDNNFLYLRKTYYFLTGNSEEIGTCWCADDDKPTNVPGINELIAHCAIVIFKDIVREFAHYICTRSRESALKINSKMLSSLKIDLNVLYPQQLHKLSTTNHVQAESKKERKRYEKGCDVAVTKKAVRFSESCKMEPNKNDPPRHRFTNNKCIGNIRVNDENCRSYINRSTKVKSIKDKKLKDSQTETAAATETFTGLRQKVESQTNVNSVRRMSSPKVIWSIGRFGGF